MREIRPKKCAMIVYDLDILAKRLQSTLDHAQDRLDRRQERLLQQLIDVGSDGEPKSLSWVCRLPAGDGGRSTFELLRLPWASLRSAEAVRIASISIGLDCRIVQDPALKPSRTSALTLIPAAKAKKADPNIYRMRIAATSGEGLQGSIYLDDQLLLPGDRGNFRLPAKETARRRATRRGSKGFWGWKAAALFLLAALSAVALLIHLGILHLP
jgi:hypothetical protein